MPAGFLLERSVSPVFAQRQRTPFKVLTRSKPRNFDPPKCPNTDIPRESTLEIFVERKNREDFERCSFGAESEEATAFFRPGSFLHMSVVFEMTYRRLETVGRRDLTSGIAGKSLERRARLIVWAALEFWRYWNSPFSWSELATHATMWMNLIFSLLPAQLEIPVRRSS